MSESEAKYFPLAGGNRYGKQQLTKHSLPKVIESFVLHKNGELFSGMPTGI